MVCRCSSWLFQFVIYWDYGTVTCYNAYVKVFPLVSDGYSVHSNAYIPSRSVRLLKDNTQVS